MALYEVISISLGTNLCRTPHAGEGVVHKTFDWQRDISICSINDN